MPYLSDDAKGNPENVESTCNDKGQYSENSLKAYGNDDGLMLK